MKKNCIPSIDECYEIIEERMLPNIKEHSEKVMEVGLAIINNLKADVYIDKNLVIAASLLHDINKTKSLSTNEPHDITGAQFIRILGYNSVAEIIEEHIILKNFDPDGDLLEKEIVFYADKRVMHNKIVTVDERISDLIIRYGETGRRRQEIFKNKDLIFKIENKINKYMNDDINDVISKLNST